MDTLTTPTRIALGPRESIILDHAAGIEVTCRQGCLWLTQYGDSRDIVLNSGQSFKLQLSSSAVLSSWHGAQVSLARLPRGTRPRASLFGHLAALIDPGSGRLVPRALDGRVRVLRVG